jgi:hypothetical protein
MFREVKRNENKTTREFGTQQITRAKQLERSPWLYWPPMEAEALLKQQQAAFGGKPSSRFVGLKPANKRIAAHLIQMRMMRAWFENARGDALRITRDIGRREIEPMRRLTRRHEIPPDCKTAENDIAVEISADIH